MRKEQRKKETPVPARKRKPGRKKIRRRFEDTFIGRLLQYQAPDEYALIKASSEGRKPPADLIEFISYGSMNPLFRTVIFRKALIKYRNEGLYVKNYDPMRVGAEKKYLLIQHYRMKKTASKELK